jgi:tetratricopeptide (TPR) repeat protein
MHLARVYLREGRLDEAAQALERAPKAKSPAYPWSVAWFTGIVDKQNGRLDDAIRQFREVLATNFAEARKRDFDFSRDYTALNEMGQTLYERAKMERGPERKAEREKYLREAVSFFQKTLAIDSEDLTAHYNLALILSDLGDEKEAALHRAAHARFKPDDNARDTTVALHRMRNPAANHAAEPVVIYGLQREGRFTADVAPILKPAVQVAGESSSRTAR